MNHEATFNDQFKMNKLGNIDYQNLDIAENEVTSININEQYLFQKNSNFELLKKVHLNKSLNLLFDFDQIITNNQLPEAKCMDMNNNIEES